MMRTTLALSIWVFLVFAGKTWGQHGDFCPGMVDGPSLVTPATAQCLYDASSRTATVTLMDDTILNWEQMNLGSGDTVTFQLDPGVANATVLNRLGGEAEMHSLGGVMTFANGRLVVMSLGSDLEMSGFVEAGEVVAVVHEYASAGDELGLLRGEAVSFDSNQSSRNLLLNGATIRSTDGDVVLGASGAVIVPRVVSKPTSIESAEAVRIFAGEKINYDPDSSTGVQFLPQAGNGNSFVRLSGEVEAGTDVEIRATSASQEAGTTGGVISLDGPVSANEGAGTIYLRVIGGQVVNQNTGFQPVGEVLVLGEEVSGVEVYQNDTPDLGTPSVGLFPALRESTERGGKSKRSKEVVVYDDAPAVASVSANSGEARGRAERAVARRGALVRRTNFFGLRGAESRKKASR